MYNKFNMFKFTVLLIFVCWDVRIVLSDCGLIDLPFPLWNPYLGCIVYDDKNTEIGSQASIRCQRGYKLEGQEKVLCNGMWDFEETPSCTAIQCSEPNSIVHGKIHTKKDPATQMYTLGSAFSIDCDPGYELTGPSIRICLENGSWSEEKLNNTCKPIDDPCKNSQKVPHGSIDIVVNTDITENYTGRIVWSVICDTGYHLRESGIVVCKQDEGWDRPLPKCHLIDYACEEPPWEIPNGQLILLNSTHGQSPISHYIVECDPGYKVNDSPIRVCQQDGHWSGDATCKPRCNFEAIHIDNGRLFPSFDPDHTDNERGNQPFIVRCDKGYQLKGQDTMMCLKNDTWSNDGPMPSCGAEPTVLIVFVAIFAVIFAVLFVIGILYIVHVAWKGRKRKKPGQKSDGKSINDGDLESIECEGVKFRAKSDSRENEGEEAKKSTDSKTNSGVYEEEQSGQEKSEITVKPCSSQKIKETDKLLPNNSSPNV